MKGTNPLLNLKAEIEAFLKGTNNIDKLMRDKVNPYVLMEEVPAPIQIGRYVIWIGNFTINNNFKFWNGYGKILALLGIDFKNFDLLNDGEDLMKKLMGHKILYKELSKLIHKTICKQQTYYLEQMPDYTRRKFKKWNNCSLKYFLNNMSVEKLIQMCRLIYIYNFDPEKKNLEILLFQLPGEQRETMGTFMSSYLENMVGLTGKFQLAHSIKDVLLSPGETILTTKMSPKEMKNERPIRDGKQKVIN